MTPTRWQTACGPRRSTASSDAGVEAAERSRNSGDPHMLAIKSSAFLDGDAIPTRFTCDGEDTSPPLEWSGVPDQALSLALVVDDPDAPDPAAPKMRFVHWVLYNMPPDARGLPEGAGRTGKL